MTAFEKLRILIAEDEAILRMDMADELEQIGFDVVGAETADKAYDLFRNGRAIDAVITDIEMPGELDGLAFARLVREINPFMPIIIVSSKTLYSAEQIPSGAVFHTKPCSIKAVVAGLHTLLCLP